MGVKTYAEFKQDLMLNLSTRKALATPTDWYGEFVNTAYSQLCTRTRLFTIPFLINIPELETSAALVMTKDVAYVTLPDDLFIIRGVWNSTHDRMLSWIRPEDYYKQVGRANTGASSVPRVYARIGDKIFLYPTPDTAYSWTIYYKKKPVALTTQDDVTEIGSEWDTPIVKLATIHGMNSLKEYDFADIEKKNFVEDVTGLCNAIYQEQRQLRTWIQPNQFYLRRYRGK